MLNKAVRNSKLTLGVLNYKIVRQEKKKMKYDFTSIIDRQGKDSIAVDIIPFPDAKVQEGFSKIPMWVADMNYAIGFRPHYFNNKGLTG